MRGGECAGRGHPYVDHNELFMRTLFTGEQLANFRHFDPNRVLHPAGGAALLTRVLTLASTHENRERALRPTAAKARELTASALIANLAAAALNKADDSQFVAVPFNRNFYVGRKLSYDAMTLIRKALLTDGLIEGRNGVRTQSVELLSRLRATSILRAIFAECDINFTSVPEAPVQDVLVIRDRRAGVPEHPPIEVELTRAVVEDLNRRIAAADIALPEDAWNRIRQKRLNRLELEEEDRTPAGDLARKSLVRSFKYDWSQGGRLYRGWWIGLPKEERKRLTIDGEPVVELDYGQLHPSILYARLILRSQKPFGPSAEEMDGDPYTVGRWTSREMRDLGKTTFARMLNAKTDTGEAWAMRVYPEDADKLPPDLTWDHYLSALKQKHEPIAEWFWVGEGLRLQKQDSDLAIAVLEAMGKHNVVTLPVHDSFIVQRRHEALLAGQMSKAYGERVYGNPIIKRQV
jgi:hypothetical protein